MKIPKETLSLAGEFAVASELCRRGIYAQLTLGLRKRTDLLVETKTKMLGIQVKAKQGRDWPNCKGIFGDNSLLIFVDYQNKAFNQRPDFYILDSSDWGELVNRECAARISSGEIVVNQQNCPVWVKQVKNGKPYVGMGVSPGKVTQHKERWDKIEALPLDKDAV